jgi:hypothetical protein
MSEWYDSPWVLLPLAIWLIIYFFLAWNIDKRYLKEDKRSKREREGQKMTIIKCKYCKEEIELGNLCSICFSKELSERTNIQDPEERFYSVEEYVQDLLKFEYERGKHNYSCSNQLEIDTSINENNWDIIEGEKDG